MLKIFTEASKFRSGHASPFADSRGNGTNGVNRDIIILKEKKKVFSLEKGSQFLHKYKRVNSLVVEYCCGGLSIHLGFASKEVFSKLTLLSPPVFSFLRPVIVQYLPSNFQKQLSFFLCDINGIQRIKLKGL